jgi:hypothetical protein
VTAKELMDAKAHRDEVRDCLVKALRLYELPEELADLLAQDHAADKDFKAKWMTYQIEKARKEAR